MFIKRRLEAVFGKYAGQFPVLAIVGPRQSGKTTLVRQHFSDYKYFSLEDPDTLEDVRSDPRDFLEHDYKMPGIILDEFQNEPQLLSYMQGIVDLNRRPGYFIFFLVIITLMLWFLIYKLNERSAQEPYGKKTSFFEVPPQAEIKLSHVVFMFQKRIFQDRCVWHDFVKIKSF